MPPADLPDDRPGRDDEPTIRPEPLGPPEKLAADAEDVEEFVEGYERAGETETGDDVEDPEVHGGEYAP